MKLFLNTSQKLFIFTLLATSAFATEMKTKESCALLFERGGEALQEDNHTKDMPGVFSDFGLDIHRKLQAAHPGESISTSPFSIVSMLGMAFNAAGGVTLEEMFKGLISEKMTRPDFNIGYTHVTDSLKSVGEGNVFSYANLLIADHHFPILPDFVDFLTKIFGGEALSRDFIQTDVVLAEINGIIERETHGMLKDVVKELSDAAMLVNAGFFKGGWAVRFDVNNTVENFPFLQAGGKQIILPMMFHGNGIFPFYSTPDFKMVSLAYKHGDFAMDVIVPTVRKDGDILSAFSRVTAQLNGDNYLKWVSALKPKALSRVGIPRWKIESRFEVAFKEALIERIPSLFDPNTADLSALSEVPTYMSYVIHATKVETNEIGTKGAFVTVGGMRTISMPVQMEDVIADHPFIAIIRHVPTMTPVFVISEWDPQALPRPTDAELAATE